MLNHQALDAQEFNETAEAHVSEMHEKEANRAEDAREESLYSNLSDTSRCSFEGAEKVGFSFQHCVNLHFASEGSSSPVVSCFSSVL